MKNYDVTVKFFIKASNRDDAWKKAVAVCEKHLRGLASVREVRNFTYDEEDTIAVNEPIEKQG